MKKLFFWGSLPMLVAGLILTGCKKDNSTNRNASVANAVFSVRADNANKLLNSLNGQTNKATASTSAAINWTSAIANIAYLKFEAKRNNTEIEIKSKGLQNVDLFALSPVSAGISIDTGTYSEIEVKVTLQKNSTGSLPLTLKGNYTTSSGTIIPVEFDFNDDAEIKAEVNNVTVDGKTDVAATIKIHLNMLLMGVSVSVLDSASQTNGVIVISNSSNSSIYKQIWSNFSNSAEGGEFEHHNHGEKEHDN